MLSATNAKIIKIIEMMWPNCVHTKPLNIAKGTTDPRVEFYLSLIHI